MNAPASYQEWLNCFDRLKALSTVDEAMIEQMRRGTFSGTAAMQAAFQERLIEAINAALDRYVRKFTKRLNSCIDFGELADIAPLFRRLKGDIHRLLFFVELTFLDAAFKASLQASFEKQALSFWNDTVAYLQSSMSDDRSGELEDALFFIRRMKLMPQPA